MEFHDKVLKCSECGAEFVFTAGEQMFFADKGFKNEPKRCKGCKAKRAEGRALAVVVAPRRCARRPRPPVPSAGRTLQFPSVQRKAAPSFAGNASSNAEPWARFELIR